MSKKQETQEMLTMRLEGATYAEIGERFGITRQSVEERLRKFPVKRIYSLEDTGKRKGAKGVLDKVILKVKKFL